MLQRAAKRVFVVYKKSLKIAFNFDAFVLSDRQLFLGIASQANSGISPKFFSLQKLVEIK